MKFVGFAMGPPATWQLAYRQRVDSQPQQFTFGNLGPQWTFDWQAWVTDDPTVSDIQASVTLQGGGMELLRASEPQIPKSSDLSGRYNAPSRCPSTSNRPCNATQRSP